MNNGMLLVTDIEVQKVPHDYWQIIEDSGTHYDGPLPEPEMVVEGVCGRRFWNCKGEYVCLGLSAKAQEALGLPLETFESLQSRLLHLEDTLKKEEELNAALEDQLEDERWINKGMQKEILTCMKDAKEFRSMNWLARLEFLFTGKWITHP